MSWEENVEELFEHELEQALFCARKNTTEKGASPELEHYTLHLSRAPVKEELPEKDSKLIIKIDADFDVNCSGSSLSLYAKGQLFLPSSYETLRARYLKDEMDHLEKKGKEISQKELGKDFLLGYKIGPESPRCKEDYIVKIEGAVCNDGKLQLYSDGSLSEESPPEEKKFISDEKLFEVFIDDMQEKVKEIYSYLLSTSEHIKYKS